MRHGPARIIPSMRDRTVRVASLVAFLCSAALLIAPAAACPVARGARIVLASQELDPDVFLWDSADRLVKYAMGDYTVETVLKHTTLIRAYSRAVTLGCRAAAIRAEFPAGAGDTVYVVGVRVVSGRERGRYGWVLSSDVRGPDGRQLTSTGQRR